MSFLSDNKVECRVAYLFDYLVIIWDTVALGIPYLEAVFLGEIPCPTANNTECMSFWVFMLEAIWRVFFVRVLYIFNMTLSVWNQTMKNKTQFKFRFLLKAANTFLLLWHDNIKLENIRIRDDIRVIHSHYQIFRACFKISNRLFKINKLPTTIDLQVLSTTFNKIPMLGTITSWKVKS